MYAQAPLPCKQMQRARIALWIHKEEPKIIQLTFISPFTPGQDGVTRVHVRLLGPCYKTGRVDDRPTSSRLLTAKPCTNT